LLVGAGGQCACAALAPAAPRLVGFCVAARCVGCYRDTRAAVCSGMRGWMRPRRSARQRRRPTGSACSLARSLHARQRSRTHACIRPVLRAAAVSTHAPSGADKERSVCGQGMQAACRLVSHVDSKTARRQRFIIGWSEGHRQGRMRSSGCRQQSGPGGSCPGAQKGEAGAAAARRSVRERTRKKKQKPSDDDGEPAQPHERRTAWAAAFALGASVCRGIIGLMPSLVKRCRCPAWSRSRRSRGQRMRMDAHRRHAPSVAHASISSEARTTAPPAAG
jgi:hypothetical protein